MSSTINSRNSNEQTFGHRRRTFFLRLAALAGVLLPLKVLPADTKDDAPDRFDALQREIESLKQHFGHYPHPVSGESWS